jgi:hypothetical protein
MSIPDCAEKKIKRAKRIALIGNGGNLAIAQHAASDFQRHLGKHCFAPDAIHMTALGGDGGWHQKWVDDMNKHCDLFIGITTRLDSPIAKSLPKSKSLLIAPRIHDDIPTVVAAEFTYHEFECKALYRLYQLMEIGGAVLPRIKE